MGIFSEADRHPFTQLDGDVVVEEAHGGLGGEPWRDEHGIREYVRLVDRQRGLYIRDESRD